MSAASLAVILEGTGWLLAGAASFLGLLFAALLPAEPFDLFGWRWEGVRMSCSFPTWMLLAVIPIGLAEAGVFWLRRSGGTGGPADPPPVRGFRSGVAWVWRSAHLLGAGCAVLVLLALCGLALAGIVALAIQAPVPFGGPASAVVTATALYALARFPGALFFTRPARRIANLMRRGLATCRLLDSDVEIDLGLRKPRRAEPVRFRLRLDELEEVRSLTYVEAHAYLRHTIGPDVSLAVRQAADLYRHYRDQIPRPRFYAITAASSVGTNVLLRGDDLFYLLAFDAEDVGDLIQAFETRHAPNRSRLDPAP